GFLYHSNHIALHCYLILLASSRDGLLSFGRSVHAGNSERQDSQAGSDRRHADQPRRASVFREVSAGHRNRRIAAAQICGDQEEHQGVSVRNLFLQALYFFFDGTSRHLSYFDELQPEEGYQAVVEMPAKQMASSHATKRFFGAFHIFHAGAFRWVLQELFLWRLQQEKPDMVVMTLDTMVMDNDEALQREGCDPTYKKVKGFQPLQLIWNGKIVDAIFR